ncbi:hypothetical protein K443DRAFT_254266 [Laccaria amethystina LaAM-08-1]|uniref:Uncharacterized protein n=1 Tax=Laccaria amethystina LaAM-08-1 TaxID=1095629 RepID=A0A0C9XMN1_9AGAR|nr:hypothetical protein K443DRAFT_254266 [Laccaria amethystina LaAM-08-1]
MHTTIEKPTTLNSHAFLWTSIMYVTTLLFSNGQKSSNLLPTRYAVTSQPPTHITDASPWKGPTFLHWPAVHYWNLKTNHCAGPELVTFVALD